MAHIFYLTTCRKMFINTFLVVTFKVTKIVICWLHFLNSPNCHGKPLISLFSHFLCFFFLFFFLIAFFINTKKLWLEHQKPMTLFLQFFVKNYDSIIFVTYISYIFKKPSSFSNRSKKKKKKKSWVKDKIIVI